MQRSDRLYKCSFFVFNPIGVSLCLIFLIGSIFTFTINKILSLLLLLASIPFFINRKGVIIDFENSRLKAFNKFFFIELGQWRELPSFSRIIIIKAVEELGSEDIRYWVPVKQKEISYKVILVSFSENIRLLVYQGKNKSEAETISMFFREKLKVDIERVY